MIFCYNSKEEVDKKWNIDINKIIVNKIRICSKDGAIGFWNGLFRYIDGSCDEGEFINEYRYHTDEHTIIWVD